MKAGMPLSVPGDKSMTHRALILAGLAPGRSRLEGLLTAFDAQSTAQVLRGLSIGISPLWVEGGVDVDGSSGLQPPRQHLDCGNSGTAARLLLGVLAGYGFPATLTGDKSLSRRPMCRVTDPLSEMGAVIRVAPHDGLPVTIQGGALKPIRHVMRVSSAQVKSALLLAGLVGGVAVSVREPTGKSRDHTERLLRAFGFSITESDGWVHFEPTGCLEPFEFSVPGDPSSAAFLVGAALLGRRSMLTIRGVGVNPTRIGFLTVLNRMGAQITIEHQEDRLGEPVGDLHIPPAELTATEVTAPEIPGLIDEIPILAVLAARASGTTVFREVGELRVKESDRLGLLAQNLRGLGVEATAEHNTLAVTGTDKPLRGRITTDGDHRIAMAFGVLGRSPSSDVVIDDMACVGVSYPGFWGQLGSLDLR